MTRAASAAQPADCGPVVDFLVIGVQKGGTTWISHLLSQHPEIHVPKRKELHYFSDSRQFDRGPDWYRKQFAPRPAERFLAEATPNYFWNRTLPGDLQSPTHIFDIAPLVHRHNPDARLILSLRDPVERAVSAYYHYLITGLLDPRMPFAEALQWFGMRSMGLYAEHYRHWLQCFAREQILTLIFERDIRVAENRAQTVQAIFDYLGVPVPRKLAYEKSRNSRASYLAMQSARHLPPGSVPVRLVRRLAGRLVPDFIDQRFKPVIESEDLERLREYYRPQVSEMSELLGYDLRQWWS